MHPEPSRLLSSQLMATSEPQPHPYVQSIHRFYEAFAARDAQAMAACYHPEIHFSDPVFPDLHGPRAGAMWRMLCEAGKDLQVSHGEVRADATSGAARWEATYTFSGTGRKVHNRIHADFRFQDGLILDHRDSFDFWAWSRQALGPVGWLLGWTPLLRRKVQAQAAARLDRLCRTWNVPDTGATSPSTS